VLRFVFDTNVLVAALLSCGGAPAAALRLWMDGGFDLVACPALLEELAHVLARPRFRAYVTAEVEGYVQLVERNAVVLPDPEVRPVVASDPGDDYLVCLARESGAHALVSGDRHLLTLTDLKPPVLSPRAAD
jgi:putative PIN family toxin of toxin-antitoxin system